MRCKCLTQTVVQLSCALALITGGGTNLLHANEASKGTTRTIEQSNLITVKGSVVDTNGEAVIGATVLLVQDPSKGMLTNIDGQFSLTNVPSDGTLRISFVGMKTIEIPINGQTNIVVTLQTR